MENRKPFKLRKVLIVYNFAQVLFSAWIFHEAAISGWFAGYSYRCEPVDRTSNPLAYRVSRIRLKRFFRTYSSQFDRWQKVAGGTFSASSRNSLTHFSSSCESVTIKFQHSMSFTTGSCRSLVSFNSLVLDVKLIENLL
jgi:hypothetical protein